MAGKTIWPDSVVEKNMDLASLKSAIVQAPRTVQREPEAVAPETPAPAPRLQQEIKPSAQVAQKDSRFNDISAVLPSRCIAYVEKAVAVRTFTAFEIQKIQRGVAEQALRHEVDAMSACLNMSAYLLTFGDFYWLMYWQRLNSYKKTPVQVQFRCTNADHVNRVVSQELDEKTLDNVHAVSSTELVETPVDPDRINRFAEAFYTEYGLYLDLPRIGDLVEEEEDTKASADDKWFNRYAALISRQHYGATLKLRCGYIKGWLKQHPEPDTLAELDQWAALIEHGVQEKIEVRCKECGAVEQVELSITPLSFLPGGNSGNA